MIARSRAPARRPGYTLWEVASAVLMLGVAMTLTLQMVSWAARSQSTDTRIAKPKLAPRSRVNTTVWVRKPGPMAEVAMRKAAPSSTRRRPLGGGEAGVALF